MTPIFDAELSQNGRQYTTSRFEQQGNCFRRDRLLRLHRSSG